MTFTYDPFTDTQAGEAPATEPSTPRRSSRSDEFTRTVLDDCFEEADEKTAAWLRSDETIERFHERLKTLAADFDAQLLRYKDALEAGRPVDREWRRRSRVIKSRVDARLAEIGPKVRQYREEDRARRRRLDRTSPHTWSRRRHPRSNHEVQGLLWFGRFSRASRGVDRRRPRTSPGEQSTGAAQRLARRPVLHPGRRLGAGDAVMSERQALTRDELDEARRQAFLRVLDECRAALRAGEARFRARWKKAKG